MRSSSRQSYRNDLDIMCVERTKIIYVGNRWVKTSMEIASPSTPTPEIIGTSPVDVKHTLRSEAAYLLATALLIVINGIRQRYTCASFINP